MSRRRGQRGSVRVVGEKYVGRYWADVPGSTKRVRKAVEIGAIDKMTMSEAKRWLANYIEEQGVNSEAHLARSQSSAVTFGDAAELWRQRQLIACGKPSSQSSMGCELRKHVIPLLKDIPLEEVNDYSLIRDLIATWQEEEREDGEVGYSYKSMKNFFGHIRAVYNFYRDETAQKGKPKIGEWFVKWKRVAPPKPIEEEQPSFLRFCHGCHREQGKDSDAPSLVRDRLWDGRAGGEVFGLHVEDVQKQVEWNRYCPHSDARSLRAGKTRPNRTKFVTCRLMPP